MSFVSDENQQTTGDNNSYFPLHWLIVIVTSASLLILVATAVIYCSYKNNNKGMFIFYRKYFTKLSRAYILRTTALWDSKWLCDMRHQLQFYLRLHESLNTQRWSSHITACTNKYIWKLTHTSIRSRTLHLHNIYIMFDYFTFVYGSIWRFM